MGLDVVEDEVVSGHAGRVDRAADDSLPPHCAAKHGLDQINRVLLVRKAAHKLGVVRRPVWDLGSL